MCYLGSNPDLRAWKEKHKVEVEKRKAEGEVKQQKAVAEGENVLKGLYADRAKVIAANKAKNKYSSIAVLLG